MENPKRVCYGDLLLHPTIASKDKGQTFHTAWDRYLATHEDLSINWYYASEMTACSFCIMLEDRNSPAAFQIFCNIQATSEVCTSTSVLLGWTFPQQRNSTNPWHEKDTHQKMVHFLLDKLPLDTEFPVYPCSAAHWDTRPSVTSYIFSMLFFSCAALANNHWGIW